VTLTFLRRTALAATLLLPLAAAADSAGVPLPGKQLYTSFCARCHGVNMVTTGASFDLRSFPKDQRERFERSVTQGLRAMPAWGTTLTPDELQALWLYVSSGGGS
jgi:cytochrome c55X